MIISVNNENIIDVFNFNNRIRYFSKRRFQSKSKINYYKRSADNRSFIDRSSMNKQNNFFNVSQSIFKNLSDRKISKNSYINDEKIWSFANESLCVKCDKIEFKSNKNHQCLLLFTWKRSYFKLIIFENSTQTSFISYNYEQYDENLKSYNHDTHRIIRFKFENSEIFSRNTRVFIFDFIVSFFDYSVSSYESKFLSLNFSSNFLKSVFNVEFFYDKKSSKRLHLNKSFQFTQDTILQDKRMS